MLASMCGCAYVEEDPILENDTRYNKGKETGAITCNDLGVFIPRKSQFELLKRHEEKDELENIVTEEPESVEDDNSVDKECISDNVIIEHGKKDVEHEIKDTPSCNVEITHDENIQNNGMTHSEHINKDSNVPKEEQDVVINEGHDNEESCAPENEAPVLIQECAEHIMVLENTQVDSEYELYNYVTDCYKCEKCNYVSVSVHVANANVSESVIGAAEATIINYVNSAREEKGLSRLWTNSEWDSWAKTRSRELSIEYGHQRPNGESWAYAIGDCYTIGENVASGQSSGKDFYFAFNNSASHRDTMMSKEAIGIAVDIYIDSDGTTYCAMIIIGSYS
jgi:uncharacterized protein YkwD